MAEIDLGAQVQGAVSLARERALRLGINLTLDVAERLPPVRGDADRLQQAVVNLLDNALRATPVGGTVHIQVAYNTGKEGQIDGDEVSVSILDDGIGLTAADAAQAFEAYYRGPGGGTGLGLTIAQEIIAAHGGRIWLAPRPEGGAEAGFGLPLAAPAAAGGATATGAQTGRVPDDTGESQALT
jgi:two-component system sensor kinase FixL